MHEVDEAAAAQAAPIGERSLSSRVRPAPVDLHPLRELDLRRWRRPGRGTERRRARGADEDPPLHGDLARRLAAGGGRDRPRHLLRRARPHPRRADLLRSASSRPASSCATSCARRSAASASSSSPTTRTTRTRSATISSSSTGSRDRRPGEARRDPRAVRPRDGGRRGARGAHARARRGRRAVMCR